MDFATRTSTALSRSVRILNVEPEGFSAQARAILKEIGELSEATLTRTDLLRELVNYDVLIVRFGHKVDREMIDAGRRLRAIVTAATGVDHLDVNYARARGIEVLSLRGEYEFLETVSASAEHSWALLLSLSRHIPQAFASVRSGKWKRDPFRGSELSEKRLGILGLGRVGRKVASFARAFGMYVAAYDPAPERWVPGVERCTTVTDLFLNRDILTIHVPLNEDTVRLVRREQLCLLSPGAILINTARGEVIEESDLLECLRSGRLAGAALDVISDEGTAGAIKANALIAYAQTHENLLITPHIAGATHESMAKTEVFMASKLAAFLNKKSHPATV